MQLTEISLECPLLTISGNCAQDQAVGPEQVAEDHAPAMLTCVIQAAHIAENHLLITSCCCSINHGKRRNTNVVQYDFNAHL